MFVTLCVVCVSGVCVCVVCVCVCVCGMCVCISGDGCFMNTDTVERCNLYPLTLVDARLLIL